MAFLSVSPWPWARQPGVGQRLAGSRWPALHTPLRPPQAAGNPGLGHGVSTNSHLPSATHFPGPGFPCWAAAASAWSGEPGTVAGHICVLRPGSLLSWFWFSVWALELSSKDVGWAAGLRPGPANPRFLLLFLGRGTWGQGPNPPLGWQMAYQAWVTNAQTVLRQRREQAQQERAHQEGQLPAGELWQGYGGDLQSGQTLTSPLYQEVT